MRIRKNITLNIEVVKAFEEVVPAYQRSRVIDALMLQYLIDEDTRDSVQKIPSETTSLNDNEV